MYYETTATVQNSGLNRCPEIRLEAASRWIKKLRHKEYSLLLVENPKVGGNNMPTTNNEDECRRICDTLSEIDGQVVTI